MPSARLRHAPSHTHASRARSCARGGNCTPLHPPAATPAVRPLYARCPPRCTGAAPPVAPPAAHTRCNPPHPAPAGPRESAAAGLVDGARKGQGARHSRVCIRPAVARRPDWPGRAVRLKVWHHHTASPHGRPRPLFRGWGWGGGGARLWAGSILVRHAETAQSQVPQPDVRVRVGVMVRVRVRAKYPPTGRGVPLLGLTQRLRCRRVGASAHRR
jgi:hypothetical protein